MKCPRNAESALRSGAPAAWVAEARADRRGRQAGGGSTPALMIFAVSIRDSFSASIRERLALLGKVADHFARRVPAGVPSLWVFPGGYFGYEASRIVWPGLDDSDLRSIEVGVAQQMRRLPPDSLLAVGVDQADDHQQAWVAQAGTTGVTMVTREHSPLEQRKLRVGQSKAAFFICGEFTGSQTPDNGPFLTDQTGTPHYLNDLSRQLADCDLLVDLAHGEASGSVSCRRNPRWAHQLQMDRFSARGIAVLAHHHAGKLVQGRPHFKHQSNWIVFRGGEWLSACAVTELR